MTHEERIAQARAALARAELRTGARSLAREGRPGAGDGSAGVSGAGRAPGTVRASDIARVGSGVPGIPGTVGSAALAVVESAVPVEPAVSGLPTVSVLPVLPVLPVGSVVPVVPTGPVAVPDLPRHESTRPSSPIGRPAASRGPLLLTDRPPLAVPSALTPLLPDGLRRGSTTAVLGSTSLVLAMIAAACTAREAWAAVVGQPSLGLLAAAQAGVALPRLAVVPHPGADAPTVVAALLDGIDVVVVGPGTALGDADRRRLMARARDRGSVLLSTAPWSGAGCVLTVEGGRWSGVGDGDGRLRAHELHITRTGRGSAGGRVRDLRVVLPLDQATDPYGLPVVAAPPGAAAPGAGTGTGTAELGEPAMTDARDEGAGPSVPALPSIPAMPALPSVPDLPPLRLVG